MNTKGYRLRCKSWVMMLGLSLSLLSSGCCPGCEEIVVTAVVSAVAAKVVSDAVDGMKQQGSAAQSQTEARP